MVNKPLKIKMKRFLVKEIYAYANLLSKGRVRPSHVQHGPHLQVFLASF